MANNISTTTIDASHHLQRQMLIELRQRGPLLYQELKPDGVEGNAYNYHLRQLKRSHLIALEDGKYQLTTTGHLVSDAFSFATKRLMLRPYHYTTLLVTAGESVLVYVPTRAPLNGQLGLPSGKVHYGDSMAESIAREMDRRQLSGDYKAENICPINVRYTKGDETVLHRPGILWHIAYHGEQIVNKTESGATQWMNMREAATHPNALPELVEGIKHLHLHSHDPVDLMWPLS